MGVYRATSPSHEAHVMKRLTFVGVVVVLLQFSVQAHTPTVVVFPSIDDESADIEDIVNSCDGFDKPRFDPSPACREKLDEYFMSRPIWDDSIAFRFGMVSSIPSLEYSVLSPRYLRFGRNDQTIDSPPRWRDVLDGKFIERIDVAERTFQKPECRNLRNSKKIISDLSETCQARELFKFSAYLDGCLTGLDRAKRWIRMDHNTPHQSYYQSALQSLKDNFKSMSMNVFKHVDFHDVAKQFTNSTLRAAWMVLQCNKLVIPEFDKELKMVEPTGEKLPKRIRLGLDFVVQPGHDAALQIAAMSGDEWAIHRYWPTEDANILVFWRALVDYKPLLVHGYLARYTGQFGLSAADGDWHMAKAYSLTREADSRMELGLKQYVAEEFGNFRASRLMEMLIENGHNEISLLRDEDFLDRKLKYPW